MQTERLLLFSRMGDFSAPTRSRGGSADGLAAQPVYHQPGDRLRRIRPGLLHPGRRPGGAVDEAHPPAPGQADALAGGLRPVPRPGGVGLRLHPDPGHLPAAAGGAGAAVAAAPADAHLLHQPAALRAADDDPQQPLPGAGVELDRRRCPGDPHRRPRGCPPLGPARGPPGYGPGASGDLGPLPAGGARCPGRRPGHPRLRPGHAGDAVAAHQPLAADQRHLHGGLRPAQPGDAGASLLPVPAAQLHHRAPGLRGAGPDLAHPGGGGHPLWHGPFPGGL